MPVEAQPHYDFEEYLALERASEIRHDFLAGELFAMVGASRRHNLIVTNLVAALRPRLRGTGCEIYANDMRVRVAEADFAAYPDVVVACGGPRFHDRESDTLLDPTLIVEVLSPPTADYDRGTKFASFRRLDSLRDYLLVSQAEVRIEHFARQEDGSWRLAETSDPDAVLDLPSLGCRLALREVYEELPDA